MFIYRMANGRPFSVFALCALLVCLCSTFYYFGYTAGQVNSKIVSPVQSTRLFSVTNKTQHSRDDMQESSLQALNHQITKTQTLNFKRIHIFNASNESKEVRDTVANHRCVNLRAPNGGTPICVHPRETDVYVSGSLISSGMWEGSLVMTISKFIMKHPGMMLLDLGCNVGTFSLYCVKQGTNVVSVDASKENLLLLSRSIKLGNLNSNITLVWNAMSDIYENVIIKGYPKNKGGSYVQPTNITDPTQLVQTTMLDDLSPLFLSSPVFIKMDIETYEWKAVNGGHNFFKNVDVQYVLMEFTSHRKSETGKHINSFMSGFGLNAYPPNFPLGNKLNAADYTHWPDNVLFSKH